MNMLPLHCTSVQSRYKWWQGGACAVKQHTDGIM
jgi:hypothetical protein